MPQTAKTPRVLALYRRLEVLPLGRRAFSEVFKRMAPYFRTIPAQFVSLEPGRAVLEMADTRAVHNHIGTVHAISLCNLAEMGMGAMLEATLPATHRWLPKAMTVHYVAKARGTMRAEVTLALPPLGPKQDVVCPVVVTDPDGKTVFTAEITLWVTEKKKS